MFASLELKAILFAIVAGAAAIGGFMLAHKLDAAAYTKLELSYAQAQATAVATAAAEQKRLDDIATQAAQLEAANQSRLAANAQAALTEVQNHVKTVYVSCLPLGFVRVLDAAALGVTAASLPHAAGNTDATCSKVDPVALARSIVQNYFTANSNAEQLNALIANLRDMHRPK